MKNSRLCRSIAVLTALTGILSSVGVAAWADAAKKTQFNLSASQSRTVNPNGSLNRGSDVNKNRDPFANDDGEGDSLDPTPGAMQMEHAVAPPKAERPKRPLKAAVTDEGAGQQQMMPANPMMAPPDMGGEGDPLPQQVQQPGPPPQQQYNPNDPDSSPDMQLAWDQWHKRVAATIFDRFNFFARAAFKHSAPLIAKVSYTVSRDGHIMNMQMAQKSTNVLFNVLVFQSVKSLDGDLNVLAFPPGSRRMTVQKWGTFTQNYGQEGFRYTVGDQERIQGRGR